MNRIGFELETGVTNVTSHLIYGLLSRRASHFPEAQNSVELPQDNESKARLRSTADRVISMRSLRELSRRNCKGLSRERF